MRHKKINGKIFGYFLEILKPLKKWQLAFFNSFSTENTIHF